MHQHAGAAAAYCGKAGCHVSRLFSGSGSSKVHDAHFIRPCLACDQVPASRVCFKQGTVVGLCCARLVEVPVLLWRRSRTALPGLRPAAGGRGNSKPHLCYYQTLQAHSLCLAGLGMVHTAHNAPHLGMLAHIRLGNREWALLTCRVGVRPAAVGSDVMGALCVGVHDRIVSLCQPASYSTTATNCQ
jgi:hypothetical protein